MWFFKLQSTLIYSYSCCGKLIGGHQAAVMCVTSWEGANSTDFVATGSKDHYVKVEAVVVYQYILIKRTGCLFSGVRSINKWWNRITTSSFRTTPLRWCPSVSRGEEFAWSWCRIVLRKSRHRHQTMGLKKRWIEAGKSFAKTPEEIKSKALNIFFWISIRSHWTMRTKAGYPEWQSPTMYCYPVAEVASFDYGMSTHATQLLKWKPIHRSMI